MAGTSLAHVVVLEGLEGKKEHVIQQVILIAGAKEGRKETGDEVGNVGKGKTKVQ